MKSFYALDLTDALPKIQAPTLVIAGDEDLIKGREFAEIIAAQISNSELAIIPGAGHAVCLEKPAILNTLLLGFVTKNS
jgi:3-oxoadipate enol-lactonase